MFGVANGFCECGCGEVTRLSSLRFVHGHHNRRPRRAGPDHAVDRATGCWEWQHGKDASGYGKTRENQQDVLAYRPYYKRAHGSLPDGLDLDHLCRNPGCVNPAHLEPVTHAENVRRGGSAKLTWDDVWAIRESSDSYRSLARQFGVSNCAISNVKNYKVWIEDESTPVRR